MSSQQDEGYIACVSQGRRAEVNRICFPWDAVQSSVCMCHLSSWWRLEPLAGFENNNHPVARGQRRSFWSNICPKISLLSLPLCSVHFSLSQPIHALKLWLYFAPAEMFEMHWQNSTTIGISSVLFTPLCLSKSKRHLNIYIYIYII